MLTNFIIVFFAFSLFLVATCKKYNLFLDNKIEKHKKFSSNLKSYSIGGVLLLSFFIYYFIFISADFLILIILVLIFIIGLFSDTGKMNSVSLRFFLQVILIAIFIHLMNIEIVSTKVDFFDNLLENNIVNILFSTFCLTVLINGTNFMDGLNGLVIKYFLIIYLIINFVFQNFVFDQQFVNYIILALSIILLFNLLGYLYLGDSGSYLLSLFTGIFLINFSNNNPTISPYFIIVLLWYPCFELLFSMIRRFFKKTKTYEPDTKHLHQLIFKYISKKFKIKNKLIRHLIISFSVNSINLISILISTNFIYNSKILLFILLINISIYISLFNFLRRI